jgi:hypothetical protein
VSISKHRSGDPFDRSGYETADLTTFVRLIHKKNPVNFTRRVLLRASELHLNYNEIDRAMTGGDVVSQEIGPSRAEVRLEIQGTAGDIVNYRVVVYLSRDHNLFAEDIRENARVKG